MAKNTKKLLTKSKRKWYESRDKNLVKGKTLHSSMAAQKSFEEELERKRREMVKITGRRLKRLYNKPAAEKYFTEDASIASQARILINALEKDFEKLFSNSASISKRMIKRMDKQSKSALYQSMKDLSGGLSIKTKVYDADMREIIKASITESSMLIKTIPEQYLKNVGNAVMRSISGGKGFPDLIKEVDKYSGQTKRRIKNLALDQSRKAYNNVNKARMEKVGVKKFEWIHSGGGINPRKDHIELDGKVFSFDDLPIIDRNTGERGIPGQAINCKCSMRPVIDFDDL